MSAARRQALKAAAVHAMDIGNVERHLAQLEGRYRGLLEAAPDAMVVVNEKGEIVLLNLQAEKRFGYRRDELLGQKVKNIIPEGFAERLIADGTRTASEALAQQIGTGMELTGRRKDGGEFPIELMLSPFESPEGILVTAAIRDISVRKDAERHLAQMEERYRGLLFAEKERAQVTLDSIGDAVACTDSTGRVTFLNRQAERVTGWSLEEAVNQPVGAIIRILDAASRLPVALPTRDAIRTDSTTFLQSNCLLQRRDGMEVPIEDSVAPIHDRSGQPNGTVIVFRDVSESLAVARQMAHAAQHDFLTGLPNRMLLHDRVNHAISLATRHQKQVALLFLDLDGFKQINDTLGHAIGDQLLNSVSRRLLDCVRSTDTISRQGGDEFVVLLSEVEQAEDTATTARRMLKAVSRPHAIDQHRVCVTASIGVVTFPDDGQDADTLIKNADLAMYRAKEGGSDCFRFFKPDMNSRTLERQTVEEGLRRALERSEYALEYQPKYCLRTGEITGAEALLRWIHPTRGPIPPAQFMPVAEECGLIVPIGAWVLREACRQGREWMDAGLRATTMAVNVSAREFREDDFDKDVFRILNETGFDPACLGLELAESVLMKRVDLAASLLKSLRGSGIKVVIDDFGTGCSSLSHLQRFPVDALKIDQSFVRQIGTVGPTKPIVTAVIGMARNLDLQVIAEGVETFDELAFLRRHKCGEAQGFYFSRPVGAEEFANMLATAPDQARSRFPRRASVVPHPVAVA